MFYICVLPAALALFASAAIADQIPTGRINSTHFEVYDRDEHAFHLIRTDGQLFHEERQPLFADFLPELLRTGRLQLFCEGYEPFHQLYLGDRGGRIETSAQVSVDLPEIRYLPIKSYPSRLMFRSGDALVSGVIETGNSRYDQANICSYMLEDEAGFSSNISVVYSTKRDGYAGCCYLQ